MSEDNVTWSRLIDLPVGEFVKGIMNADKRRKYHNFDHILTCYDFLKMVNYPYSRELDYAILFHDIIYDHLPEKEIRSAKFFVNMKVDFIDADKVYDLILATIDHDVSKWSEYDMDFRAIILTDLSGLASENTTRENYTKIMTEICALNGITEKEFAQGNLGFMEKLSQTIQKTIDEFDETTALMWTEIKSGIELTMEISRDILK